MDDHSSSTNVELPICLDLKSRELRVWRKAHGLRKQATSRLLLAVQLPSNDENKTPKRPQKVTTKRTPRKRKADDNQLIIDAGQKSFGLDLCPTCGMTYNVNHEHDVKLHDEYHNRFKSTKSFHVRQSQLAAWKKQLRSEIVLAPMPATVFILDAQSSSTLRRRVESIVTNYVNPELGVCDDVATWKVERLAMIFVVDANPKEKCPQLIAAVALVDPIDSAVLRPDIRILQGSFVGVNRLWVHESMRRRGVATTLLNVSRRLVYPNIPISRVMVAFDEPEAFGLQFVISYTKQKEGKYLVYTDD